MNKEGDWWLTAHKNFLYAPAFKALHVFTSFFWQVKNFFNIKKLTSESEKLIHHIPKNNQTTKGVEKQLEVVFTVMEYCSTKFIP